MEEQKTIFELKDELDTLCQQLKENDVAASKALTDKVQLLTDFEILPIGVNYDRPWNEEKGTWEFRDCIRFKTDDKYGYDFGSSIDIIVRDTGVYVNVGTSGEYSKKDKYQVERVNLLAKIFNHEEDLIDTLKPFVIPDVMTRYYKVSIELDKMKRAIKEAQIQEELKQAEQQLLQAKYLAYRREKYDYNYQTHEYDNYRYEYQGIFKITKMTKKCVYVTLANYNYAPTERLKKDVVLSQIRCHTMFCLQDKDEQPEPHPKAVASQDAAAN